MTRTATPAKTSYEIVQGAMAPTIKRTSTRDLCTMLAELDRDALAEHERIVAAVLSEAIYDRHPEVVDAIDAWIDDLDCSDTRTQTRVILDAALACA